MHVDFLGKIIEQVNKVRQTALMKRESLLVLLLSIRIRMMECLCLFYRNLVSKHKDIGTN